MASNKTISHFLIDDHKTIVELISELEREWHKEWHENVPSILKKLRWELERHMYLEEKALFLYCELLDEFNEEFRSKLQKDHDWLLDQIKNFENHISILKDDFFDNLKDKLQGHIEFEIDQFYRKLDEISTPKHTEQIINAITQAIQAGFFPLDQIRKYASEKMQEHQRKVCNLQ
jgi:hypothetical protein